MSLTNFSWGYGDVNVGVHRSRPSVCLGRRFDIPRDSPLGSRSRPVPSGVSPTDEVVFLRSVTKVVAATAIASSAALLIAACGSSSSPSSSSSLSPSQIPQLSSTSFTLDFSAMSKLKILASHGSGNVAAILPDTVSSTRYVEFDAPYLKEALTDAGLKPSQFVIQNAQGSDATEYADAQADITKGAKVLIMDPIDPGVGAKIESYAKSHGVPVVDPRRQPEVLRQLQQRLRRHAAGQRPGQLHQELGREEPEGHRDARRPDGQQRDPVR
jgi:hypothetical protein